MSKRWIKRGEANIKRADGGRSDNVVIEEAENSEWYRVVFTGPGGVEVCIEFGSVKIGQNAIELRPSRAVGRQPSHIIGKDPSIERLFRDALDIAGSDSSPP